MKSNALKTVSDSNLSLVSHPQEPHSRKSHAHEDHSHSHSDELSESDEDLSIIKPMDVFFPKGEKDSVPKEFDAVRIKLDAKVMADLAWTKELSLAKEYIKDHKKIFWEFDLGLFSDLKYPLDHKAQFLSLCLSLEHFKNSVWKEFREHTLGACLYTGDLDFSRGYIWNENQEDNLKDWLQDHNFSDLSIDDHTSLLETPEKNKLLKLFCRDSFSEYLKLLSETLPDTLALYILLKTKGVQDPYEMLELCDKEKFLNFHVALENSSHIYSELTWDKNSLKVTFQDDIPLGICLSFTAILKSHFKTDLKSVIRKLSSEKKLFRLISALTLTNEWDGLDDLIVDSSMVDKQLFRKLQGFAAAGGRVVHLGNPLKIDSEISFDELIS